MNQRLFFYMILVAVASLGAILLLNMSMLFNPQKQEKYLSYNGVRGMAIEHNNKLYTLNFEQQNAIIKFINQSLTIADFPKGFSNPRTQPLDFTKLIIYRFDAQDIVLTPIAYVNTDAGRGRAIANLIGLEAYNLVYQVPEWNGKGFLEDTSQGSMKQLIGQTYDP